jgi:hypothetical protein
MGGAAYDDPSFPPSSYLYGLQRASWILAALSLFGECSRLEHPAMNSTEMAPLSCRYPGSWGVGSTRYASDGHVAG